MLRRIEIEEMKSTLAISTMFADVFAEIVEELESLLWGADFRQAPCPACANRDERLRANAGYPLDWLATSPGHRDPCAASPALCFAHFELLLWESARTREDGELIRDVQRKAARALLHELREHVRKHDNKFRERDSWERAVFITAGWPAPAEPATKPERRR